MKGVTAVSSEKFDACGNGALGGAASGKRVLFSAAAVLREENGGFLRWRIFPESPHRGNDPFSGLFWAPSPNPHVAQSGENDRFSAFLAHLDEKNRGCPKDFYVGDEKAGFEGQHFIPDPAEIWIF